MKKAYGNLMLMLLRKNYAELYNLLIDDDETDKLLLIKVGRLLSLFTITKPIDVVEIPADCVKLHEWILKNGNF